MTRQELLEEATRIVTKDRNATHGAPEKNFDTIAAYWSTYLGARGQVVNIGPVDVAAMMVLMKISRLATSPAKQDNWVDMAGYTACGGELATSSSR